MPSLPNILSSYGSAGAVVDATVTATATVTSTETSTVNSTLNIKNLDCVSVASDLVSCDQLTYQGETIHLDEVVSDINVLQTDLTSLENRMTTTEGDVTAIEGDIAVIEGKQATDEADIALNASNIASLVTTTTTQGTTIAQHTSDIATLNTGVATNATAISTLNSTTTTQGTSISTLQTQTQYQTASSNITTFTGTVNATTGLQINGVGIYATGFLGPVTFTGTSVEITGIPSTARRVVIYIFNLGTSNTNDPLLTFGLSNGSYVPTTIGFTHCATTTSATTRGVVSNSVVFSGAAWVATNRVAAMIDITKISATNWVGQGTIARTEASAVNSSMLFGFTEGAGGNTFNRFKMTTVTSFAGSGTMQAFYS